MAARPHNYLGLAGLSRDGPVQTVVVQRLNSLQREGNIRVIVRFGAAQVQILSTPLHGVVAQLGRAPDKYLIAEGSWGYRLMAKDSGFQTRQSEFDSSYPRNWF